MAALGFLLSRYAINVPTLCISLGGISGIGLSFCFNTAIIAVTYYFEKRRALATAIAVCGSGTGTSTPSYSFFRTISAFFFLFQLCILGRYLCLCPIDRGHAITIRLERLITNTIGCIAQFGRLRNAHSRSTMAGRY